MLTVTSVIVAIHNTVMYIQNTVDKCHTRQGCGVDVISILEWVELQTHNILTFDACLEKVHSGLHWKCDIKMSHSLRMWRKLRSYIDSLVSGAADRIY